MWRLALLLLASAATGCHYPALPELMHGDAGEDSVSIDAGDASVDATPDAPHVCYTPLDIGGATFGTTGNPIVSEWFDTPTSGPNAGKKEFVVSAQLDQTSPTDVLAFVVARPTGGFVANQAYAFATDATPNLPYSALALMYGDFVTATTTYQQYLFAANGSVTFSQIGETSNSTITGTMNPTDFREVNEATGAVIPNGCTTRIGTVTFYLREQ